jgi:hypothetical protein
LLLKFYCNVPDTSVPSGFSLCFRVRLLAFIYFVAQDVRRLVFPSAFVRVGCLPLSVIVPCLPARGGQRWFRPWRRGAWDCCCPRGSRAHPFPVHISKVLTFVLSYAFLDSPWLL